LRRHSPYHFLRELPAKAVEWQEQQFGAGRAARFGAGQHEQVFASGDVQFLYELLPWDTAFFGTPTYRLFTALFDPATTLVHLTAAVLAFRAALAARGAAYCFVEVPAEDIRLLQALTQAGWRWNETRLHYYRAHLAAFAEPRFGVRPARPAEMLSWPATPLPPPKATATPCWCPTSPAPPLILSWLSATWRPTPRRWGRAYPASC
jgi:dTDP-4-amino-4,6-dideoxy-D-galactose acyltransferase